MFKSRSRFLSALLLALLGFSIGGVAASTWQRIFYGASLFLGQLSVRTSGTGAPVTGAAFEVSSTTKAAQPCPVMTTTQVNALSNLSDGLCAFDTTLHVPKYYNANTTAWVAPFSNALTNAHIFVGSGGVATDVAVSGDVSLTSAGLAHVNSVQAGSVTGAGLAASTVADSNLVTKRISACVKGDCSGLRSGAGATCITTPGDATSARVYTVTFSPAFAGVPTVVASSASGIAISGTALGDITSSGFVWGVTNAAGSGVSQFDFCFTAIYP